MVAFPRPSRRWTILALGLLLLVLAIFVAWNAWTLRSHLLAVKSSAQRLSAALSASDERAAGQALQSLTSQAAAARARAGSPGWQVRGVAAVRRRRRRGSDGGGTGEQLAQPGPAGRAGARGRELNRDLVPRGGRIDPDAVARFHPLTVRSRDAFARADNRLAGVERDGLTRWTRPGFVTVADAVARAHVALDAAARATEVLPTMLGAERPREYLLAFNTNAEIRTLGGYPGATAILRADNGRIALGQQGAAADFDRFPEPVDEQSAAEREIYGVQPAVFFGDTNFVPDYPRAAELMRAMWRQKYDRRVDGTISLDVVTLSYLLEATGPVRSVR